jgi:hypothetical protein
MFQTPRTYHTATNSKKRLRNVYVDMRYTPDSNNSAPPGHHKGDRPPTPILQRLATLCKANTWKGYTKPTHIRAWDRANSAKVKHTRNTKLSTFRPASHSIRRQHMLVYFYAEENTLWRIYWRHNIPCETWEESPGSRTGHCAKQRCHIVMTFVQHHAWSLSNIAVVSKTRAWNTHPLVINKRHTFRYKYLNFIKLFQYFSSYVGQPDTKIHWISDYSCIHTQPDTKIHWIPDYSCIHTTGY